MAKPWKILVTGSNGLVGSDAVEYFDRLGHHVIGVDNNMRHVFFGDAGDTLWNLERLINTTKHFTPIPLDVRDQNAVNTLFNENHFDLVIHCAAQPSHDKAAEMPILDFYVNAAGTVNLLEATRRFCPEATFIFMSTNKVYGDTPNEKKIQEYPTRYEYADCEGIDETCRIDQSMHSLFGASKLAADIYAQEYGRYFGMNVGIFRGGCITGPTHSGVRLHGFLSYLIKVALSGGTYTVYGYKGKQVRDNLHSIDLVRAFHEFALNPRPGEVYNIGGGRANSISVIEAITTIETMMGRRMNWEYSDQPRKGDHICYITNMAKFKIHYPNWDVTRGLSFILQEIYAAEQNKKPLTVNNQ
jgi:CDP-paratose 2-epimerase